VPDDQKKSKWEEFSELLSWSNIQEYGWRWWFRNWVNLVDDPVDATKEWLH
jgi:hypothetical protein